MAELLELLFVCGVGVLGLVGMGVVAFLRKGRARAPQCAFVMLLAQLPPLLAAWLASRALIAAFEGASSGGFVAGAAAAVLLRCVVLMAAGGAFALGTVGLFTLGLLALPFQGAAAPTRPLASLRRTAFLVALAAAGVASAAALFEYTRQTVDIARIVVLGDGGTPAGQAAAEKYDVLTIKGSRGIGAISSRIARGSVLAQGGAPYLAVVVFGACLVGAIVAWPVEASTRGAALWLVLAALFCASWLVAVARLGWDARGLRAAPAAQAAPPVN